MRITFDDRHGQHLRGRVVSEGRICTAPILVVRTVDRAYIVDAQTKREFLRAGKEPSTY